MAVDLDVLRNDPAPVVLRKASLRDFRLGILLAVSVFALTFALLHGDAALTAPAVRFVALGACLGLAGLILYRTLFRLAVTTTFRLGSDAVEWRESGVLAGRTRRLDCRRARVRIAGRDATTVYFINIPVRTPSAAMLEPVLRDGRCLRIGSVEEGGSMLLVDRLNAILAPLPAPSAPPAP